MLVPFLFLALEEELAMNALSMLFQPRLSVRCFIWAPFSNPTLVTSVLSQDSPGLTIQSIQVLPRPFGEEEVSENRYSPDIGGIDPAFNSDPQIFLSLLMYVQMIQDLTAAKSGLKICSTPRYLYTFLSDSEKIILPSGRT